MKFRRLYQPGGHYFFTVVTEGRQPILIEHIDRLRRAFQVTARRHPFALTAIVVLPDHLHTIWQLPEGDPDFSTRWRVLKRLFSAGLQGASSTRSLRRKRERGVWERRFWEHLLRNEGDLQRHLDYIHYNPVKHGYCGSPGLWPHSSFSRFVETGVYDRDWGRTEPPCLIEVPE